MFPYDHLTDKEKNIIDGHTPVTREQADRLIKKIENYHRMETLVTSIDSLSAAHGLSVGDICSALKINIDEYIDVKKRITEE